MVNIEGLSLDYKEKEIFKNINLKVEKGRWSLEGNNGAGKTTLLKILNKEDIYDSKISKESKIYVKGETLLLNNDKQVPLNLTEKDFADYVLYINKIQKEYKPLCANRILGSYSTGELKLVVLRILSEIKCDILLLDEYLTNLDRINFEEAMELLISIEKKGTIIIVASNDVEVKKRFNNKIIIKEKKLEVQQN